MMQAWTQLRGPWGVGPVELRTEADGAPSPVWRRGRLEEDEILRLYDETDYLVAKFDGERIVEVIEPGADQQWTVVLAAGGVALAQPPRRLRQPGA
jgi:hypothetical protein